MGPYEPTRRRADRCPTAGEKPATSRRERRTARARDDGAVGRVHELLGHGGHDGAELDHEGDQQIVDRDDAGELLVLQHREAPRAVAVLNTLNASKTSAEPWIVTGSAVITDPTSRWAACPRRSRAP